MRNEKIAFALSASGLSGPGLGSLDANMALYENYALRIKNYALGLYTSSLLLPTSYLDRYPERVYNLPEQIPGRGICSGGEDE